MIAADLLSSELEFVNAFFFACSPEITLKSCEAHRVSEEEQTKLHHSNSFSLNDHHSTENLFENEKKTSVQKHDLFIKDGRLNRRFIKFGKLSGEQSRSFTYTSSLSKINKSSI